MRVCLLSGLALTLALGACGPSNGTGPISVAIIGEPDSLLEQGVRLSPAAQHLRAASIEGLVALDPTGQVVPAIAERWIVTDDGLSYIFRLRDSTWPDGEPITAAEIRRLLRDAIARTNGTSLGLDLAKVDEIRAMTDRVVELRLSGPMPDFLRLLAQPELGLAKSGSGAGPMTMSDDADPSSARLNALPPEARGLPARENWEELARPLIVRALPTEQAVAAFAKGEVDLVLNGRLADFPLATVGPLSRGTVQLDPVIGLFGLAVRSDVGVLSDPGRREALSMALDRAALIQPFGVGGWQPSTWIVRPETFPSAPYPSTRWSALSLSQRRDIAARRIAAWEAEAGEEAVLRVGLPQGPGSDLLFRQLSVAWAEIGLTVIQVGLDEGAELQLQDRLARYSSPRWFLNQFHCGLNIGLCSPDADELVRQSLTIRDPAAKESALVDAHFALMAEEVFIPLGAPVRWSLVRGSISAYQANAWGVHPLFPLSQPPN